MNDSRGRSIERELSLEASPAEVWRAITEAQELTKWFVPDLDARPGQGGEFRFRWGPEESMHATVEVWEEERHLRYVVRGPETADDAPAARTVVDFFLETRAGKTVLRLVHSGFGTGEDWDDEYDSVRDGWSVFLTNLTEYLERHRGEDAAYFIRILPAPGATATWRELVREGLGLDPDRLPARGEPVRIETADDAIVTGTVLVSSRDKYLLIRLDTLRGSILGFQIEKFQSRMNINFTLVTYGLDEDTVTTERAAWNRRLERHFDEPTERKAS